MNAERARLEREARPNLWKRWGPYLTERQWGTVREDYSEYGTAWDYLTHDMASGIAYRWGEEGIAGNQGGKPARPLCLATALQHGLSPEKHAREKGLGSKPAPQRLHHHRELGQAQAGTAQGLGEGNSGPAELGHLLPQGFRESHRIARIAKRAEAGHGGTLLCKVRNDPGEKLLLFGQNELHSAP